MSTYLKQAIIDSYRTGDFTLSSGGKSHEYWDVRAALLHPEAMYEVFEWLTYDRVFQPWQGHDAHTYVGIGTGGALIVGMLVLNTGSESPQLLVRDERKEHGRQTLLEGWPIDLKGVCEDSPLLLVDDVCTTGASLLRARQAIWDAAGWQVPVHAAVILGRDPAGWTALQETEEKLRMDVMHFEREVRP